MDAAEKWLAQHDPEYGESSLTWRDLDNDGEYVTPRREIPVGNARSLEAIVAKGDGEWVSVAARFAERECLVCERTFMPYKDDHSYCSPACRTKAYRIRVAREV